jgi:tetratricopeptide (TPR) repeat protein
MSGLIQELRRRHVFRVAGLYVGIAWIVIEAADILLPAFEAPDWVFRAVIMVAFGGFPVAIVLAWLYQFTEKGLVRDEAAEAEHLAPAVSGRLMDFIVIGVLVVALGVSVYLNIEQRGESGATAPATVSLLVAEFDNQTGDPIFDGSLSQALLIGMEAASFVNAYPQAEALKIAEQLQSGAKLDAETARLVAVREGLPLVLTGTVAADGKAYRLEAQAVSTETGEAVADTRAKAADKSQVLIAVSELSDDLRRALGGKDTGELAVAETFTTTSLEAVYEYTVAQRLALAGEDAEAIEHYRAAIQSDPEFGRAYSGWAVSAGRLGRNEEAGEMWEKALAALDDMTEREKYRTLGGYYLSVTGNYEKAVENYRALVELYPADAAGYNNLAVAYFLTRRFPAAREAGRKVLEIYPQRSLYRANYALYAMYAGDLETAIAEAGKVIEADPDYHKAYLPAAVAAVLAGDFSGAEAAYARMAQAGAKGASLANTGLADLAMYRGDVAAAAALLEQGIAADRDAGNSSGLARKQAMLAEVSLALGENERAAGLAEESFVGGRLALTVPAASLFVALDDRDAAERIGAELAGDLQPDKRAYAKLIEAELALAGGRVVDAVDALRAGLERADLWLLRFRLGQAFVAAEYYAEALSELEACERRRGEAVAVFLDDVPTLRALAPLPYWLGRAREGLGMAEEARASYQAFLDLQPDATGELAEDARKRLAAE